MIRRLNKKSDLKDLIKSCPSGVIDDIYAIEYYIQGYNTVIQENFTKKETMLEVIIPSTDLETLPNGILMRRAYYKVVDASYPDGYYNLEFEDNMNVWIGENESEEPIIPDYVTEEELAETLGGYATQEWVGQQGYITTSALSGYATESWVSSQGYLTSHQDLSSYATQSWVSSQGYLTSHQDLTGYATESWVSAKGYYAPETAHAPVEYHNLSEDSDIDIEYPDYNPKTMRLIEPGEDGFVIGQISVLDGDPTIEYVDKIQGVYFGKNASGSYTVGLYQYAVTDKNGNIIYPESFYEFATSNQLNSYATQKWVNQHGYATQTWVGQQGYITSSALSGYATEQWVSSQQFATQSWVSSQGYLVNSDLSGYATQSWTSTNFVAKSEVWTGTETEWNQLTAEEKASYTIALITQ